MYHFLRADMRSGEGNEPPWTAGETRVLNRCRIVPCEHGYHASPTAFDALQYAPGPVLCLVQLGDDAIPHGDPVNKYASRTRILIKAVNIERELRLFAADCGERVLGIFETKYPNDDRPRRAIEAARAFANGEITDAARDAAAAAAWGASSDAACDASWAVASDAASAAAWAAACSVVRDAAWAATFAASSDAASAVASAVEKEWQATRFNNLCDGLLQ